MRVITPEPSTRAPSLFPRANPGLYPTSGVLFRGWLRGYKAGNRSGFLNDFHLTERVSALLGAAFCRDVWQLFSSAERECVEAVEAWADGGPLPPQPSNADFAHDTLASHQFLEHHGVWSVSRWIEDHFTPGNRRGCAERQGRLLVSAVGPGWEFDPAWASTTAVQLAGVIYKGREWGLMPILADALQDEGCEEKVLLEGLRSPESLWCRGARILDALLGKE